MNPEATAGHKEKWITTFERQRERKSETKRYKIEEDKKVNKKEKGKDISGQRQGEYSSIFCSTLASIN